LAQEIAQVLGSPLGEVRVSRFSDGETFCEIKENVRGLDVYLVQPTSSPVNDHVMELLIMCDALRRASAKSITAVIPYYGYARQDRKVAPRTPITSKLVADVLVAAGVSRVLTVDLHAGQIQGFFNIPMDHLYALPVFLDDYLKQRFDESAVFISPDAGGVERTRAYSKKMGAGLAIIDKRRERANVSEVMHLIGDVKGKDCIIVDDMIDTAGTLCNAAKAVMENGARSVVACATHGVLSGPAVSRIQDSVLQEVVVTNSIAASPAVRQCSKIRVLSIGRLLGEAIRRIHNADSVSSLFV
jgi:ribose-phosphate pyrophosphokinase